MARREEEVQRTEMFVEAGHRTLLDATLAAECMHLPFFYTYEAHSV